MTVKECYAAMEADYEDVFQRLMTDERIRKYLLKFAAGDGVQELCDALDREDYETAFRHVHSMKGMSLNLSLTRLAKSSDTLCEALRGGKPTADIGPLLEAVKEDYAMTVGAIGQLE